MYNYKLTFSHKNFLALIIATYFVLFSIFCPTAFALTSTDMQTASWNYGTSYSGTNHGTYSPYKGRIVERMVVESSNSAYFSFDSYFTFNQTIVNNLSNYMNNDGLYFTMDIANANDNDKSMNAVYVYTDLPNPKVEVEDDPYPFGNGYNDEAEAVARSLVSANTEYCMFAHFNDFRNSTPTTSEVKASSGISSKSLTGEYNTQNYSTLATLNITSTYQGK